MSLEKRIFIPIKNLFLFGSMLISSAIYGQGLNEELHKNLFQGPEFITESIIGDKEKFMPSFPENTSIYFEAANKSRRPNPDGNYIKIEFRQGEKSIGFYDYISNKDYPNCDGIFEKVMINGKNYNLYSEEEKTFITEIATSLIKNYAVESINSVCKKSLDGELNWKSDMGNEDEIAEKINLNKTFYFTNGRLEKIDIKREDIDMILIHDEVRFPGYSEDFFKEAERYLNGEALNYVSENFPDSKSCANLKERNESIKKFSGRINLEEYKCLNINKEIHENLFSGPKFITNIIEFQDKSKIPEFPKEGVNIYFCAYTKKEGYVPNDLVSIVFKEETSGFLSGKNEKTIEFLDKAKIDLYGKLKCDGIFESVIINGSIYECKNELDEKLLTNISTKLIAKYVSDKLTLITNEITNETVDKLDWFTNITSEELKENEMEKLIVNGTYHFEEGILKEIDYYDEKDHITHFRLLRNSEIFPKFIENYFKQIEERICVRVLEYTLSNENFCETATQENLLNTLTRRVRR